MENRSAKLNKRLQTDRIINLVVMAVVFFICVVQIFIFVRTGEVRVLQRSIHSLTIAVCLLLVSAALGHIKITGKPFDKKIITLLQVISVVTITGGFLAIMAGPVVTMLINGSASVNIDLSGVDLIVPLLGVMLGIISEIFSYGNDLQADNDLIA